MHDDVLGDLPPLPVEGGVREGEAIALLRQFYAQENQNAPEPQKRTRKQLELARGGGGSEASEAAQEAREAG